MKYRTRWILIVAPALLVVLLTVLLVSSPYRHQPGQPGKQLVESVDIERPCADVFAYLGNSANASRWSVYIHHITPLNAPPIADGAQGSIRRSFRNADERGMRWDELFTIVEPARRRQLRIFNVVDSLSPRDNHLVTEQLYAPIGDGRCRLSFSLFFERPARWTDELAMSAVAYKIAPVFRANIHNVKRLVEAAAPGAR
jgi:hypothetical protein